MTKDNYNINEKLFEQMFPFQRKAVFNMLEKLNELDGVLLASEMGVGKTLQTIALISTYSRNFEKVKRVIIFAPASLIYNWQEEFFKWTEIRKDNIQVIKSGRTAVNTNAGIHIISYDLFRGSKALREHLHALDYQLIVWDEAHNIKRTLTSISKRATAATLFIEWQRLKAKKRKKTVKLIAITGTPLKNKPLDAFVIFQTILNSQYVQEYRDVWAWAEMFCDLKKKVIGRTPFGDVRTAWAAEGVSNREELSKLMKKVSIRDLKSEVQKDLPPKLISKTFLPFPRKLPETLKESLKAVTNTIVAATEEEFEKVVNDKYFITVKKEMGILKAGLAIERIKELMESVEKLVVFYYHKAVLEVLKEGLKDYRVVSHSDASTNERKQEVVNNFQQGDAQIFLGQIQSAGTGITLTAASHQIFVEFSVVPSDNEQAESRCNRTGAIECTNIYYYLLDHDFDKSLFKYVQEKQKMIDEVMN